MWHCLDWKESIEFYLVHLQLVEQTAKASVGWFRFFTILEISVNIQKIASNNWLWGLSILFSSMQIGSCWWDSLVLNAFDAFVLFFWSFGADRGPAVLHSCIGLGKVFRVLAKVLLGLTWNLLLCKWTWRDMTFLLNFPISEQRCFIFVLITHTHTCTCTHACTHTFLLKSLIISSCR